MKFKTTKKAIRNNYTNIIKIGFDNLQHLLNYEKPIAYITRVEGWACDIYEINENTVISTGYDAFGNITPDCKIVREYDQKARQILCKNEPSDTIQRKLANLLGDFINEVTKG